MSLELPCSLRSPFCSTKYPVMNALRISDPESCKALFVLLTTGDSNFARSEFFDNKEFWTQKLKQRFGDQLMVDAALSVGQLRRMIKWMCSDRYSLDKLMPAQMKQIGSDSDEAEDVSIVGVTLTGLQFFLEIDEIDVDGSASTRVWFVVPSSLDRQPSLFVEFHDPVEEEEHRPTYTWVRKDSFTRDQLEEVHYIFNSTI